MWLSLLGAALVAVVVISVLQYRAASRVYRPLSQRQPARRVHKDTELGMEAMDMAAVRRTQRRNESLERAHTGLTRRGSASETDIAPLADDETYSARYHAAFNAKTKPKDRSK